MLNRAFEKGAQAKIKILTPTSAPAPSGLNASKKTTYRESEDIPCIWIWKDATSDNEVGERQEYRTVCQIRPEDLGTTIVGQECRVQKDGSEWLVDTIHPVQELEGFSLIRIEVTKPKAGGNKV
ncbi:hypothetical protein LEP1GSC021_4758 [Leptospira noguchii str. 1993005606]|uniref:Head-tail adaptor protein n=2 Tax=Leptospira noguchii TaxID=28182 RepID=M6YCR7_9LEPT|nr:hypothetical protein [Leptospira noguchii]EMM99128.1 hypothetical protein LEP1GSC035_3862 [Leptospira noguchii str. 2007001578]EMO91535.1 hypothetical protein LEP1GSC024_2590 [Leptospira noguchii str. 2001034031]EPE86558.1 hypothetical protein LEP1GSC021_4758 [Leptospira noguchii str. 1993005606]